MAFGGVNETVIISAPPRGPMYLYSNVGQSTVTGNQITDLLREVPYSLRQHHFEPRHIQYLLLCTDMIDIIETQVAENDGELVDFQSGVTSVTLSSMSDFYLVLLSHSSKSEFPDNKSNHFKIRLVHCVSHLTRHLTGYRHTSVHVHIPMEKQIGISFQHGVVIVPHARGNVKR